MSYAVLHVAEFALQAVLRTEAGLEGKPAALLEEQARKAVLVQANAAARAAGVQAGFTATQALARCAELVLRARSAAAEAEAEAGLLAAAWSLAPRVERTAAGICTVDLTGRPPGSQLAHARAALARLHGLGLEATAGVARTPLLALDAARLARPVLEVTDEDGFLAPLPLQLVDPPPELAGILEGWGIRTLGALTALAKADVGRRLGQAGVDLWERAAGETDRPIQPCAPAERFAAALDLEHEVETLEPLLFVLRRFVDRLALQLANAGMVAGELALDLRLADATTYQRGFRLPEPTGDPDILFRALHTHLETLQTAAAIAGVGLVVQPTRPLVRQHGLFDTGLRDPHGFAETLARVGAVVGADRVGTPALEATHRPDAFALTKPADLVGPVPTPPVLPLLGLPLRRFRPPLEAQVETGPDGPAFLRCRLAQSPVRRRCGPWRRSGEWWQPGGWSSDEWDVELAGGGLLRLACRAGRWWVDGAYD